LDYKKCALRYKGVFVNYNYRAGIKSGVHLAIQPDYPKCSTKKLDIRKRISQSGLSGNIFSEMNILPQIVSNY
jgi:hypothetical protein